MCLHQSHTYNTVIKSNQVRKAIFSSQCYFKSIFSVAKCIIFLTGKKEVTFVKMAPFFLQHINELNATRFLAPMISVLPYTMYYAS